ncbi:ABC transporter permease subunit [Paenibacillus wynnii]|uniref:ABC transporter permease n=1 Tax=Paenibacillus wynnii TaxID=268407 RepID=A0A098MBF7_9BACL|nr:ABC transporter permease subunit [Paenibacillus wynnii]KGE19366.1 ABC transporter permease [Paenibacillus wynnii]
MNIFLHELKAYRKSTIIWLVSLTAIMVMFMSMFPSFSKDAEQMTTLLQGYPEALRKALSLDLENFFTILGFYSYALTFIVLTGAIQAMNIGVSIVSKEVREKTADFLLTKPVTRTAILTAKLLAAFVSLLITNIVYGAAALMMANQVKAEDFNIQAFLLLSLTLFIVQLIFLAVGIVISVMARKIKSVLTVSLATVFSFYFIGTLGGITDEQTIRYFTPFKYVDTAYILKNSGYEVSYLIVGAVLIAIAMGASYYVYSKKDIHSV